MAPHTAALTAALRRAWSWLTRIDDDTTHAGLGWWS